MKFGRGADAVDGYDYGNIFQRQHSGQQRRLLIGPSGGHLDTMLALAACLDEPFKVLYVLIVPNGSGEGGEGRYESPGLDRGELESFLRKHADFLEGDGRHNIWIASLGDTIGQIVYDRHNVLYAYGPVPEYIAVLASRGLGEGPVEVPSPHWHKYHSHFNQSERELIAEWAWTKTPLREGDDS